MRGLERNISLATCCFLLDSVPTEVYCSGMSTTTGTHTERYGDVAAVPAECLASVARFVEREWGPSYRMGYVGTHTGGSVEQTFVYVFQVKASDGSRFAVGVSRYGAPFELEGNAWFAFLQLAGVEATVRGVTRQVVRS
jgi:hypothetical protein